MMFIRLLTLILLLIAFRNFVSGEVVEHKYYTLSYNEKFEQPNWVTYVLSDENLEGVSRTNDFREDEDVSTGSSGLSDYKGSGYDRGHLCPAGSMKQNREAMSETFLMSNISPQHPSFNRGVWKSLENYVRKCVLENDSVRVWVGPIFRDNRGEVGEVTIPGFYFKVLYIWSGSKMRKECYIIPNEKVSESIDKFKVSEEMVEVLIGIKIGE